MNRRLILVLLLASLAACTSSIVAPIEVPDRHLPTTAQTDTVLRSGFMGSGH